MIECYECETLGKNCPAHHVPPAAQMCACGQPTQGHNDHYCNPPMASPHDVERRNFPRTCAEAGDFCVDQCTLRSADRSILDPDCFRGPRGTERLAAWRRSQAAKGHNAVIGMTPCARDENGYMVPHDCGQERRSREKINDAREASIAAGPQERELPTPIQLPQCRFCGGPGHTYGERCSRVLSGRSFNLQSPSARLGYAITQLRGLHQLNAEYVDMPGAQCTPKFMAGMLKYTVDALDAVHEALADLYTGRL